MAKKTATPKNNTLKLHFDTSWSYAPAPESRSAATIASQYDLYINGAWQKPVSKKYFSTINPATEEKLAEVADAGQEDVNRAVTAARTAYDKYWKKMPAKERAKYIFRIARMVQQKARELAIIETLDGGKPIRESRDFDVPTAANHFFYYAGWADKLDYAFPNRAVQPLGVAGQIIPWNFPLLMAAWKIAPALATGNTVVLKPAETTPLTALKLAEILAEADLPPGVVNIITVAELEHRIQAKSAPAEEIGKTAAEFRLSLAEYGPVVSIYNMVVVTINKLSCSRPDGADGLSVDADQT